MLQVLVSDPKELDKIREREFDITKERIQKILDAGANVILTTKGIDDMSLKYFVEAGAIACRRVPKEDLRSVLFLSLPFFASWVQLLARHVQPSPGSYHITQRMDWFVLVESSAQSYSQ